MPNEINNTTEERTDSIQFNPLNEPEASPTTSTNDIEFEKYKIKINTIRWAIGTVGITLLTFIINWGFKDRSVGMDEISQYDKYVTEILVLNNDPVKKRMLAQYFAHVTPSSKLKCGWKSYYKEVNEEYLAFLYRDSLLRVQSDSINVLLKNQSNDTLLIQKKLDIESTIARNDAMKHDNIVLPSSSSNIGVASNPEMIIDIFYLEDIPAESIPIATKLANLLKNKYPSYLIRTKQLSKETNNRNGYKIGENQIRYEKSEESIADEIREFSISKKIFPLEQLAKKQIEYQTPNYISIFIRNM